MKNGATTRQATQSLHGQSSCLSCLFCVSRSACSRGTYLRIVICALRQTDARAISITAPSFLTPAITPSASLRLPPPRPPSQAWLPAPAALTSSMPLLGSSSHCLASVAGSPARSAADTNTSLQGSQGEGEGGGEGGGERIDRGGESRRRDRSSVTEHTMVQKGDELRYRREGEWWQQGDDHARCQGRRFKGWLAAQALH